VHAPIDEFATVDEARLIVLIVTTAAQRHAAAARVHEVSPAVVDMRGYVHGVLEAEIARARARGSDDDTEALLRHFSGALLHGLIAQGHGLASTGLGPDWADAVRTVFPAPGPSSVSGPASDSASSAPSTSED